MRRTMLAVLGIGLTACTAVGAGTSSRLSSSLVTLRTRPGVSVDFLLITPPKPIASVILLEGGPGILDLAPASGVPQVGRSAGFLATARNTFAKHGLVVALVDAPSDKQGRRGMLEGGFRGSDAHVVDIDTVASWLTREKRLPVWLVGISLGSRSAAHIAIHGKEALAGLILASSSTHPPRGRLPITAFGLDKITVPTLVIAHKRDGCPGTPPSGAEKIVRGLIRARKAEARYFEGGQSVGSHPCRPRTHHTFYGIEDEVVASITQFIRTHTK